MARRSFAELVRSGKPVLGTWTQITAEECVDILGAAGLEFTIVDCEHSHFGIETAERLFRACDANGMAPVVRAPSNDRVFIGRALDAGASAVLVPGISSADDAMRAVAATRYAPDGARGACPCVRASGHYTTDWPGYVAGQRHEVGIIALVETREGLDNVEAIARVEGLLAMMVGPFDLSVALGRDGDYLHPECQAALERMLTAAEAANLPVIVPLFSPEPEAARRQQLAWMEKGVRVFAVGSDKILFSDAVRRYARALK
ncbi:MAG: aldolase/citrate lyase family protein [Hyphomicrobiaceae bacterium]|nr:aldolase/citrate lyase family protein [Hyphomicrobiaceae bacterium]